MPFKLQKSFVDDQEKLIFEDHNAFNQALKDGFFLLKIPKNMNLASGDLFAKNFYKKKGQSDNITDEYKGFAQYTPDTFNFPHEGYYLREEDQAEQFFLEKRFWGTIYPQDLNILAHAMNQLALTVLKNILTFIGIPEKLWAKATGDCINNKGTHHLTFNHFRPEQKKRGLNTHKDSGWITLLRSHEPGLEAWIDNTWEKINPEQGFFIVNFGCAMEILTAEMNHPISAVIHRVNQTVHQVGKEDRYSYALFTDSSFEKDKSSNLYAFHPPDALHFKMCFDHFLETILKNTYKKDTVGLY